MASDSKKKNTEIEEIDLSALTDADLDELTEILGPSVAGSSSGQSSGKKDQDAKKKEAPKKASPEPKRSHKKQPPKDPTTSEAFSKKGSVSSSEVSSEKDDDLTDIKIPNTLIAGDGLDDFDDLDDLSLDDEFFLESLKKDKGLNKLPVDREKDRRRLGK